MTGPSNGTYIIGQSLDFTANLSENVTVTGTPRISLTIGATTANASYSSGSGTNKLVFRYTIVSGDSDVDGITWTSPINLNGGTINDAAGNAATLTFTAPVTTGVLVDGVAPSISTVTPPGSGSYRAGQNLDFTFNYNDTVVVDTTGGTPRISLNIGGINRLATYLSGSGTSGLLFRYTVQSGDNDSNGIGTASGESAQPFVDPTVTGRATHGHPPFSSPYDAEWTGPRH